MSEFDLQVRGDGVQVIEVVGDIDLEVAKELYGIARRALDDADELHLNLAGVDFIDSSGIGSLVRIRKEAAVSTKVLRLVNVPAGVVRVLTLTGLDEAFALSNSDAGHTNDHRGHE